MQKVKEILSALKKKLLEPVIRKGKNILISLVAAALVTAIVALGALQRVDRWVQDWMFQQRGMPSESIVLIGIDETTLDELGPYGPTYRKTMAYALQVMASDPDNLPAVVAIDVLYEGESTEKNDAMLADAAAKLKCAVTASMAEYGDIVIYENGHAVEWRTGVTNYVEPYPALRDATTQGHINAMADKDGILRHALLRVENLEGKKIYSMAAQTAKIYLEKNGQEFTEPPLNSAGHYYVPFTTRPGDYYSGYSLYNLVMGEVDSSVWAGKIVLIGPYATALSDDYFTAANKGLKMFGVEYQANVIQSLIEKNFKAEAADLPQLIALFLISFAAMMLFLRLKTLPGAAVCAGLIVLGLLLPLLLYYLGVIIHVLWLPSCILVLFILSIVVHYILTAQEKHVLALKMERIDAELTLATRIQSSSLPKVFPPFPERKEFDLFASMTPAKEVGGDLYDFVLVDDDHLALVIGDVSGKGVPAALFMMVSKVLIHNAVMNELSPGKVLQLVNHQLCANNPEDMFVTVWLGMLEISTGKLKAANAGHEYPAVMEARGQFELLKDRHGLVIGGMDGVRYREYEVQLQPGAKFFVYTDGVAEATNAKEELFGTDRMIDALRTRQNGTPEDVLDGVKQAVQEFVGSAPQFDDLTMLCIQYNGPQPSANDAMQQSFLTWETT